MAKAKRAEVQFVDTRATLAQRVPCTIALVAKYEPQLDFIVLPNGLHLYATGQEAKLRALKSQGLKRRGGSRRGRAAE